MKKNVKNNVYWIGYMDWDLQTFHGDDYTYIMAAHRMPI